MSEDTDQEDKTEDPTERRVEQAIERGDVPKSTEIATFFSLAAGLIAFMALGGKTLAAFLGDLRSFIENAHQVSMDKAGMLGIASHSTEVLFRLVALPFVFAVLAGLASGLVMHRFLWTTEPLTPQFNRISPFAGLKRLFGREAWVHFFKSLIKFFIISVVVIMVLWPERKNIYGLIQMEPITLLALCSRLVFKLLGSVLAIFALLAALDVFYQRFSWRERLKMTREEMKQEFKETEGSPEVKGRLRKMRMEFLRKRMMAQVPKSSVIITNPTHYAVALRYEAGMNAPVLLAKGVDLIALRIREIAQEHEIAIVENPPLARALYARVEIDQPIPEEHYRAVAEVIGYVMRMRHKIF